MKTQGITVRLLSLGSILEGVDNGSIALPDFQRDFEWSYSDIEQMLVTSFMSWPAGSLLLLEGSASFFTLKPFSRGPGKLSEKVRFVVLDGQQRITALYHAVYNKGDYVYYIDARKLDESGDVEEAIQATTRSKWRQYFSSLAEQLSNAVIPCSALKSPTDFFTWRDQALEFSKDLKGDRDLLTRVYQHHLSPIHSYELPAVVLEDSTDPPAVARIFERVNRLGMRLNTFDLMVAKTYKIDWNLRERWKEFLLDRPVTAEFVESDGMLALQVIALRAALDVRQAAVLKLSRESVHGTWETATNGLVRACDYFTAQFGARSRKDLPYESMIILFAAIFAIDEMAVDISRLKSFFLARSFSRAYDVASNSRIVADYKRVIRSKAVTDELLVADLSEVDLVQMGRQGGRAISNALALVIRERLSNVGLWSGDVVRTGLIPEHFTTDVVGAAPPSSRVLSLGLLPRALARVTDSQQHDAFLSSNPQIDAFLEANFLPPGNEYFQLLQTQQWEALLAGRARSITGYLQSQGVLFRDEAPLAE